VSTKPKYMTPAEVCAEIQISRTWLNKLVRRGEFPEPMRLGKPPQGRLRFRAADVDQWMRDRSSSTA